jgi:hypothetical protein
VKKFFLILFFIPCLVYGQTDTSHTIKVHFLYGSKPLHKYKKTEAKFFGGLHGGHVSIEVDSIDYGFVPVTHFHVFSHRKNLCSGFIQKQTHGKFPYPQGSKFVSFVIPVSTDQYEKIKLILSNYCEQSPYDYAFLGMRCAAATQDVLGQTGIVERHKRFSNIFHTFYPKKLRKRIFKLAKKNHYKMIRQEGRLTRKWEKD